MHVRISGKKGIIVAAVVSVALVIFVITQSGLFLDEDLELYHGTLLFVLSILGGAAMFPLLIIWPSVNDRLKMLVNTILFFALPFLCLQMVECFNNKYIYYFSTKTFLANYMIYLVLFLVCWLITGRFRLSGLIITSSLYFFAMANAVIEQFRDTPLVPSDLFSIRTAMNVADNYSFVLTWQFILGSILFLLIFFIIWHMGKVRPQKLRFKILSKALAGAYVAIIVLTFFFTDISVNTGYVPDFWDQARGYHKTGSFFNFCLNTKYLVARSPSGYDADDVTGYLNDTLEEYGVDPDGDTSINILTGENDYEATAEDGEYPNIIFIMNESFADLRHLGDLETNVDIMPYIDSLSENTIKGWLSMPVFGAGTSNSEFEALTGDSITSLPLGSNIYQLYIKQEIPSIVSTVNSLGYSNLALHPYYASGWNREEVYQLLGFSDFISIEDIIDEDILEEYKKTSNVIAYDNRLHARYPAEGEMLLRRFISDSYDFKLVEDFYEERDMSKPFFLFNVTMQNHGSYNISYRNFDEDVYVTNMTEEYEKANRYLSLIKASDQAFEELTEYFTEHDDEPTIICMFGDHLPSLETEFYEELMGCALDDLTIEQEELRYETPFVIWANYDIEEAEVDHMSSNYLSILLEQTAGLPMTQYDKFLAAMYQDLPVITTVGYIDADDNYYYLGSQTPYDDLIYRYSCIEYNSLMDKTDRQDALFYLDDSGDSSGD